MFARLNHAMSVSGIRLRRATGSGGKLVVVIFSMRGQAPEAMKTEPFMG